MKPNVPIKVLQKTCRFGVKKYCSYHENEPPKDFPVLITFESLLTMKIQILGKNIGISIKYERDSPT